MQMKRYFPLYILLGLIIGQFAFSACKDDPEDAPVDNSDQFVVMVKAFSLKTNDSILTNLDSVFFSINLNEGTVYNADSLPLGTRVDSLGVNLTLSSVSKAEITMPGTSGADTIIDFIQNGAQAINFSKGYVTLHLESVNELVQRDYRIYVNVHKMKPDSLSWGNAQWSAYPTSIAAPTELKAIEHKGQAICFATDGATVTRAVTDNPGNDSWQITDITLPEGLMISSIIAGPATIYAIDLSNRLHTSADGGVTWESLDATFTHIYGVYGSTVLGVDRNTSGRYVYVTYPASGSTAVPDDAPVSGTSQPVTFTSEWSSEAMMMIQGGTTSSGEPVNSTWAYDGSQWAPLTNKGIPALSGVTLVPYFTYRVGANWVATKQATLLAIGGTKDDGRINRNVYLSLDRGVNWALGGELLQLPAEVPSLSGAQALVFEQTLTSRSAAPLWHSVEMPVMPAWFTIADNETGIAPIDSWKCPYIYLLGGRTADGQINTQVWRGVINRLSFKPLQ